LQKVGLSPQTAVTIDNGLSILNTIGGAAAINAARHTARASFCFRSPQRLVKEVAKKGLPPNHMWSKNRPFKNKTAAELDKMFRDKGFDIRGNNPMIGHGSYLNPKNGRQYRLDPYGRGTYSWEPNHVDVAR
jgi:hypothetical protein